MDKITWPIVAIMALLMVFTFGALMFLAWLAKYWDIFGENDGES